MNKEINILEKIEYVHATLQEQRGQTAYTDMIDNSISIIEELREKYIGEKYGNICTNESTP